MDAVVKNCKHLKTCYNEKRGNCVGCNIWNYLNDIKALEKWCKEHGKVFVLFTMEMQKSLVKER